MFDEGWQDFVSWCDGDAFYIYFTLTFLLTSISFFGLGHVFVWLDLTSNKLMSKYKMQPVRQNGKSVKTRKKRFPMVPASLMFDVLCLSAS